MKADPELLILLKIFKEDGIVPNFSELSRVYGHDRRTIKKIY